MATIKTRFKLSTGNVFGTKKRCGTRGDFAEAASGIQTYYPLQKQGFKALQKRKTTPKRSRIAARQRKENPCPEMQ